MNKIKILLIEDEEFDVVRVQRTLSLQENMFEIVDIVSDGKSALGLLEKNPAKYDLIIMDFQIAGGLIGEELLLRLKRLNPAIQVIVITKLTLNNNQFEFANKLLKAGAFWYCTKYPTYIKDYIYQPTDFIISLYNAYQKKLLEESNLDYNRKINEKIEVLLKSKLIIGKSPQIKSLVEQIKKYAKHEINILIHGESGTGKELVAFNIHYNSPRKLENFIVINCGSIPTELIESELFGYEKGAFTGAYKEKKGLFELADKGTLFLDEIGDLPLKSQVKLLRVLQNGEIEKIGRTESKKVNVRVIAATNKDLETEVKEKNFRKDLYYRLNIIRITIPPLRNRSEDIFEILGFYLKIYSQSLKTNIPEFTDKAKEVLYSHSWPGNIREVKTFAQRILLVDSHLITADLASKSLGLLPLFFSDEIHEDKLKQLFKKDVIVSLKEFERIVKSEYIQFVRELSHSDGEAAEKLGMAQPNFSRMIKSLNLR